MSMQKVCILGGGLTGLITAVVLSKHSLSIDLITNDFKENINDYRSLALSQSNYNFLKKNHLIDEKNNFTKPINEMKIYHKDKSSKFKEILKFSPNSKNENILYMTLVHDLKKKIKKIIKKTGKINIKTQINEKEILNTKNINYNLLINCTGPKSKFTKKNVSNGIYKNYKETAVTAFIEHSKFKNSTAKQFFTTDGPLALLPITDNKTSAIWSLKSKFLPDKYINKNKVVKKKIKLFLKDYLKIKSVSHFSYNSLNFNISRKYYKNRILNFGDILHQIHPFAGQGFNMILRDLIILSEIIKKNLKLGLDIGDETILLKFTEERKLQNFFFANGVDMLNTLFSIRGGPIEAVKDFSVDKINKNNFIKKILFNFANKGFNF